MNDANKKEAADSAAQDYYVVSSSPHAHSGASVRRIMLDVILAMIPAAVAAVWFFGFDALRLMVTCVFTCVLTEAVCRTLMRRDVGITDLSAIITGMLLAFNLPPSLPTWKAALASAFAIAVGKQIFGGLGYNPFNPALLGRVFLLASFPVAMTTWSSWTVPSPAAGVDAVTTCTPLGLTKTALATSGTVPFAFTPSTALDFFLGRTNGCIGEVSDLALLIGGLYLLARRCICWQTPVFYVGTVAVFAGILRLVDPAHNMPVLFHLLSGGLTLGALFMATDMVTTPVTRSGMAVFGIGCGILTVVIRRWGGYPEGVSFAILIMNGLTPLINRATRPAIFGRLPKRT